MMYLMKSGFNVSCIDIDARQGTISRYIKNREDYAKMHNIELPIPNFAAIPKAAFNVVDENEEDERNRFEQALDSFKNSDFIYIL